MKSEEKIGDSKRWRIRRDGKTITLVRYDEQKRGFVAISMPNVLLLSFYFYFYFYSYFFIIFSPDVSEEGKGKKTTIPLRNMSPSSQDLIKPANEIFMDFSTDM